MRESKIIGKGENVVDDRGAIEVRIGQAEAAGKSASEKGSAEGAGGRAFHNLYVKPQIRLNEFLEKEPPPSAKEILEFSKHHRYNSRNTENLSHTACWDQPSYNEKGGLKKATRQVSFMTESGQVRDARATLDMTRHPDLAEITEAQSVQVLNFIRLIDTKIARLSPWIEDCHKKPEGNPLDIRNLIILEEAIKVNNNKNPWIKDPDFATKRDIKDVKETLKDIDAAVEAMDWADDNQKAEILRMSVDFIYDINRGMLEALLNT